MKKRRLLALILCFLFSAAAMGCGGLFGGVQYTRRLTRVFSGSMDLIVDMIGKNREAAYGEMLTVLQEVNKEVNINDPSLSTGILELNRAKKNTSIKIGRHAYYLLQEAKQLYEETNKAFNVAAYQLTYLWGVDVFNINYDLPPEDRIPPSFKNSEYKMQEKPTSAQIEQAKTLCDLDKLIIWEEGEDINKEYFAKKEIDGLMVDLGGIAKGYAADLCAEICKKHKIQSACINLSGNLYVYGKYYDAGKTNKWKNYWTVTINSPEYFVSMLTADICAFKTSANTTAVTSGDYERFRHLNFDGFLDLYEDFLNGGISYEQLMESVVQACHIIDPQRGMPYNIYEQGGDYLNKSDSIISCTVITDNSMYADAYSTAACVMGLENAASFLTEKGVKAIIFTKDKRMSLVGGAELTETSIYKGYKDYTLYNP